MSVRWCCCFEPLSTCLMHSSEFSPHQEGKFANHWSSQAVSCQPCCHVIEQGLNKMQPSCLASRGPSDNMSFQVNVRSGPYAGPMMKVPLTFGNNYLHACPELVRQMPHETLDCCAHDMWGAGYLMHRALTNTSPWWFSSCGDGWDDCKQMCKLHEDWVSPCCPVLSSSLVRCCPCPLW